MAEGPGSDVGVTEPDPKEEVKLPDGMEQKTLGLKIILKDQQLIAVIPDGPWPDNVSMQFAILKMAEVGIVRNLSVDAVFTLIRQGQAQKKKEPLIVTPGLNTDSLKV